MSTDSCFMCVLVPEHTCDSWLCAKIARKLFFVSVSLTSRYPRARSAAPQCLTCWLQLLHLWGHLKNGFGQKFLFSDNENCWFLHPKKKKKPTRCFSSVGVPVWREREALACWPALEGIWSQWQIINFIIMTYWGFFFVLSQHSHTDLQCPFFSESKQHLCLGTALESREKGQITSSAAQERSIQALQF